MHRAIRELEVIAKPRFAEHDAIEAGVILETPDLDEAQLLAIHGDSSADIGNRACYP
jgi:hypothetical protein